MFYIGLDLGQRRDHSAIAVVERQDLYRAYEPAVFDKLLVRWLERVPLGTPYPRVVERVREIAQHRDMAGQCRLVVDGTGVGVPVLEMLQAAKLRCEITAVTITGGERESRSGGGRTSVPKRDLIAGVQLALEKGELKIAKQLRETGALVRELMQVRMTAALGTGKVRIGADGAGEHDDLVIALALACWRAKRREIGWQPNRLIGI
jgi:hypothetical protein